MTGHDQLWKDLVRAFFGDFVRIVVPRMAQELRLGAARFLKDEYFTDVPRGRRQLLDLVAEVESRTGDPEIVLVHVEVEARTRKAMERRMWRYAMQLRLRHHKPVVPIALHLRGGARRTLRDTCGRACDRSPGIHGSTRPGASCWSTA